MKTELQASKRIADFLSFYDEALSRYLYCYDQVNKCDKLKNDILHIIELGTYKDRNEERRLQTQLKACLKDRRYYKDRVEELEPFIELFKDTGSKSHAKDVINQLKNALGATRKVENYHENRSYKPRILKDEGYNG